MTDDSPAIHLEVLIEDPRWTQKLADLQSRAKGAICAGFAQADYCERAEICVLLTDDARIQVLNRDFRGKDKPTNVLSFPSEETPEIPGEIPALGDIALSYETLIREAGETGRSIGDHFQHLIVHASLHLIGYTHEAEAEAERMEALEIAALAGLGVSNPYLESEAGQIEYGTREQ